jgi:magnesium chelatase family protein
MNPCRCGRAGEPGHVCRRGARCASDYQARISGPLLDRIDIRIEVPALAASDLIRPGVSETSAEVAERVAAARGIQRQRYAGLAKVRSNAQAGADLIETVATPERAGVKLLEDAAAAMRLTARGYHRVLKLARTLADLDGAETVARIHVAEALAYRAMPLELEMAA